MTMRRGLAYFGALALAATACGGGAVFGADCDGVSGWVGESAGSAMFVSWTEDDGALSGTLDYRTLATGSTGAEVDSTTVAFTGSRQDDDITLSLQHGLGAVTNLTGTLDGDELSLVAPVDDGSLSTTRLQEGCSDDFNIAVESLRQQAAADQEKVADEAAEEAAATAFAQAGEELDDATADLTEAAKALRRASRSAEGALGAVRTAVDAMRASVEKLRGVADSYNGSYDDDVALDDASYAVDDADYAVDDALYGLDDAYYEEDSAKQDYKDAIERVQASRTALEDGAVALDLATGANDFTQVDEATARARRINDNATETLDAVRSEVADLKREQKVLRREAAAIYNDAYGM